MTTGEPELLPSLPETRQARTLFHNRDFSLLFSGQFISQVGDGLNDIAIPWIMLSLTGSGFQLSLVLVARFVPVVLFALFAGVLADRVNRRALMIVSDFVRLLLMASLAVADLVWGLTPAHLYIVAFLEATFGEIFGPAKDAFVPKLIHRDRLDAANGILNASGQLAFLVSPPVGGFLLALMGPAGIFSVNAVTFGVSAATIVAMRTSGSIVGSPWRPGGKAILADIADGLRIIRGTPLLMVGIGLAAVLNFVVSPIQVLLPLFVQDVRGGGPELYGSLVAALFVGLLGGAILTQFTVRRFGRGFVLIAAVLVLGTAITLAPWPSPLWAPAGALLVAGFCLATLSVAATALLQQTASEQTRGRVFALYNFSSQGVRPLAFLAAGALSEGVDLRILISAVGVLTLLAGLAAANVRDLRATR